MKMLLSFLLDRQTPAELIPSQKPNSPELLSKWEQVVGSMDGEQPKTKSAKPTTTFVHVDTAIFRDVVQRLTGQSEKDTTTGASKGNNDKIPPTVKRGTSNSKLHQRRKSSTKPQLEILKPKFRYTSAKISPFFHEGENLRLPSPVTPSTLFAKLTILEQQEHKRELSTVAHEIDRVEEENAIKQRRFYLHPSPRSKPGYVEPELLNLFPLPSYRSDTES